MVVCPRCGCPYDDEILVVGERVVACEMCTWRGESSELLEIEDSGQFQDPRVLIDFMRFMQTDVSPLVAQGLVKHGLVTQESSVENVAFITKLLVDFSRAGFQALLKGILLHGGDAGKEGEDQLH